MKHPPKSKIRIIAGKWRNHQLEFLNQADLRPTPNRLRETLFNLLPAQIQNAHCLDLFAGSGALGFEAASRGAAHVTLVDDNHRICNQIHTEIERFKADEITVINNIAEHFIASCQNPYDIIFLDPPFTQNLLERTLKQLAQNSHMVSEKTTIYIEHELKHTPSIPENYYILREFKAARIIGKLLTLA